MSPKEPAPDARSLELTSGFQYPSKRDELSSKSPYEWMKGFQNDCNIGSYWRVHDNLYDLESFMEKHPGGKFWLETTRGTDITELFESYHHTKKPEAVLKKYFVKEASHPRISPFTFEENGFFKTLKRKVTKRLEGVENGPTFQMILIQDSLFYSFLLLSVLSVYWKSYLGMILAGGILAMATIAAHNFFHQKDNWRMHIFDFGLNSSEEWRIAHGISHHMFPNTIYDYELSSFEPFFELLPMQKSIWTRGLKSINVFLIFCIGFYMDYVKRLFMYVTGKHPVHWTVGIHFLHCFVFYAICGSLAEAFGFWLTLQTAANFIFMFIGLIGAHHHHTCYIEGDLSIQDKDWGLHQIAATSESGGIMESLFLTAVTFGNHTLHHFFPAIDHSLLPLIVDDFRETCTEFGVDFQFLTPSQAATGFWNRLSETQVSSDVQAKMKKLKKIS